MSAVTAPPAMWTVDPDRLFPADGEIRSIARDLFALVESHPIISPHSHVSSSLLNEDTPFGNAAELFVTQDHYVTRLLHASGVPLERLTDAAGGDPREVWRTFCGHWHVYAGTASGYWLTDALVRLFRITEQPSAETADALYDAIGRRLATHAFRPRALFDRFGIEVLATTDDPMDDLAAHRALAADPGFTGRVVPTFRPDAYIDPSSASFVSDVERLVAASGGATDDFSAYIDAIAARRDYFIQHGAVSADHGVREPYTVELDRDDAARLFTRAVNGELRSDEVRAFSGHMLYEMAAMSVRDGLVMTIHAGSYRNHSTQAHTQFGSDVGFDIPVRSEFTRNLRPLLERFGRADDFHLILFTLDESCWSREIAPLAGVYPSVFIGAPWWFLDAPDAIQRFRAATTETAGFYRGSGFVDDTRAFMSIPARHDTARRLDSVFLARYVREGRMTFPEAERIAVDLVDVIPRKAFKL